jgi:D-psicose/D-tagatose/L-ribulose 3-epimerase
VLNRFEGYLLNTVQQGLELLAEVNSPHVRLHAYTFHLNIEEQDIVGAIRAAGAQLGHFHCSENNRRRPGTGHIPWTAIGRALDEIGYTGWIVMESFVRPAGEVGRTLSIWRPLAEDLGAEAQAGARFLRRQLAGVYPTEEECCVDDER